MKNKEIEFKYDASKVELQDFNAFCTNRRPLKFIIISGYDHFYAKADDPKSFYRHRVNTNENQLTFKRKTSPDNNYVRVEHNIDLPLSVTEEKIGDLCAISGYEYNFSLFKNCFIYNFDYYTLVYYICYDISMREMGRFIEIEMKEDYDWGNEEEAYGELLALETLCKKIGTVKESRVADSLFEMYRK